jgi:hypothetical protein
MFSENMTGASCYLDIHVVSRVEQRRLNPKVKLTRI